MYKIQRTRRITKCKASGKASWVAFAAFRMARMHPRYYYFTFSVYRYVLLSHSVETLTAMLCVLED